MKKLLFVFFTIFTAQIFAQTNDENKPFPVTFTDIAANAGLKDTIIYGGVNSKKYIIETNGCGVAFFFYFKHGRLVVFFGNG